MTDHPNTTMNALIRRAAGFETPEPVEPANDGPTVIDQGARRDAPATDSRSMNRRIRDAAGVPPPYTRPGIGQERTDQ
ncbi:MAG: hypothetical protein M3386_05360 [Actinomycetota bacterium]|nr:hypothetical protein [Actinomycetota bacterium]